MSILPGVYGTEFFGVIVVVCVTRVVEIGASYLTVVVVLPVVVCITVFLKGLGVNGHSDAQFPQFPCPLRCFPLLLTFVEHQAPFSESPSHIH